MNIKRPSILSQDRKAAIKANRAMAILELKLHRERHKALMSRREINLSEPAWVRVNPGPSSSRARSSYRLCIGFQNIGCKYRERDAEGLGCLMCGYYARTAFKDVDRKVIVEQFKAGLIAGYGEGTRFDSIEFLNDGSFLNTDEFDKETQADLLATVSRMRYIERVLIESRPEHVNGSALRFVLDQLRGDQLLEVGIGLETADDFIRDVCINKGFALEEFEDAVSEIACVAQEYPNRISTVAYLLVKPPFLTQREGVEDALSTLEYLHALGARRHVHIVAKLEPAAIADGTILSLLYQNAELRPHYEPLSYWAVLEILARAVGKKGGDAIEVRIGAREDMDDVLMAPAIYNADGETFHPLDFVVYESLQKFNQHQDILRVLAVVSRVYHRFYGGPFDGRDSSLMQWLVQNAIEGSAIVEFARQNSEAIKQEAETEDAKYDIELMSMIYAVLDIMEGYSKDART